MIVVFASLLLYVYSVYIYILTRVRSNIFQNISKRVFSVKIIARM